MVRVRTRREIELIAESAQIVADTLDMLSFVLVMLVQHLKDIWGFQPHYVSR